MNKLSIAACCLFLVLLISACVDDDTADAEPRGQECISNCAGAAECVNGHCGCPEWSIEIAPKFCSHVSGPTFATFDYHENILDTTVVTFDKEPTTQTWETGDFRVQVITGRMYSRADQYVSLGSFDLGTMQYSGNPLNHVDSLTFWYVADSSGGGVIAQDGWVCEKLFKGRFIDANTISGYVEIPPCVNRTSDPKPKPPFVQSVEGQRYPATFRRLN